MAVAKAPAKAKGVSAKAAVKAAAAAAKTSVVAKAGAVANTGATTRGMTGNEYRDLIASYIHHNYAAQGLVVYVEISLGKTVIGKDRFIDVFVVRPEDR